MNTILGLLTNFIKSVFSVHTDPSTTSNTLPTPQIPIIEFPPLICQNTIKLSSPNFTSCSYTRNLKYIIIHCTESEKTSAVPWLTNPVSKVSAHYVVDRAGLVIQLVEEKDIAWHAGESSWNGDTNLNTKSIGIELINLNNGKDPYPKIQMQHLMGLCISICKRDNIFVENVLRHSDIAPNRKTDPGAQFKWTTFVQELKQNLK